MSGRCWPRADRNGPLGCALPGPVEPAGGPSTFLDGTYRWVGAPPVSEIIAMMTRSDPNTLSPATLEGMLKAGQAEQLARMMRDAGMIFPAFYELLVHEKWPVRLGAMVVMETLIEADPPLASQVAEGLWKRFDSASETVKGDLLYLFGEIGGEGAVEKIESVRQASSDPGLAEAAAEALRRISEKPSK